MHQNLCYNNPANAKENSPLQEAALEEGMNLDILSNLMCGEHYISKDPNGKTALLLAVDKSNFPVVETLLNVPCLVHTQDANNQTPLHYCRDVRIMRLLIEILRRRNSLTPSAGWTPIGIDTRNNYEQTPLHLACIRDSEAIIEMLVDNGADVHAACALGRTPLVTVCRSATKQSDLDSIVRFLVRHGASTELKSNEARAINAALKRRGYNKKAIGNLLS